MNHIEYVSCPESCEDIFSCTETIFLFNRFGEKWFLSRATTSRHMKSVPSYVQVNYIGVGEEKKVSASDVSSPSAMR